MPLPPTKCPIDGTGGRPDDPRVKAGLPYRDLLAALMLAGVRNIQPRPAVGFKFHAVLVINSAHLASLASSDSDRWLPIFWALDRFKAAQLETQKANGWRMTAVNESKVPPASKAREAFIRAAGISSTAYHGIRKRQGRDSRSVILPTRPVRSRMR